MSLPSLNWAILGTGWISDKFVYDLTLELPTSPKAKHTIAAIGASSVAKAQKFVDDRPEVQKQAPFVGSYEDTINDPKVQCVYIGLPHTFHYEWIMKSLNAGKHVLCEKPFTVNKKQAEECVELARKKKLFLMEGLWTRFFPITKEALYHIFEAKSIGDVIKLKMDFSIDFDIENLPKSSRLISPECSGGAILDVGVYSMNYWRLYLGDGDLSKANPIKYDIKSFCQIVNGVDLDTEYIIKQADGKTATMSNSFRTAGAFAKIIGTKGTITITDPDYRMSDPTKFKLEFKDKSKATIEKDFTRDPIHGLIWEADAVAADICAGKTESETMPLDETLIVMGAIDQIRQQNGLKFPYSKYE